MDLRSLIIKELQHRSITTKELSIILGVPRVDINSVLYGDCTFVQDSSIPVKWSLVQAKPTHTDVINTIVLVDLGNTHDCVKMLEPYASCGDVLVIAFCDRAYAGYPSNMDPSYCDNIYMIRSQSPYKNAADTALIWTCCSIINRTDNNIPILRDTSIFDRLSSRLEFIVVTKDQGFMYLEDLVSTTGHTLVFCRDWDSLKRHL